MSENRSAAEDRSDEGTVSRGAAAALDAEDPLAGLRDDFTIAADRPVYLDGNSLGRLPRATRARLERLVGEEWGHGLVRSWDGWIDLPGSVGDQLGAAFLGAAAGQVLIADSTSVNLYKLASAAVAATPGAIVVDRHEFPSDRYVLAGIAHQRGSEVREIESDPVEGPTPADVAAVLAPGGVSLVVLSLVGYRSAAWPDVDAITRVVHEAGALVLWDCSHAVGSVPIQLDASGADLAVGCTYKYLNAGPGAPAFLYVRADHQATLRQPIWGWFGQTDQFAMAHRYEPARGIGQFGVGTPSIPGLVAVEQGISVLAAVGIDALRTKSAALTSLLIELVDDALAPLGFSVGSPRRVECRGGHVSLRRSDAEALVHRLLDVGVVTDFRAPDSIRLAPVAAYTRFVDVWDGVDALRRIASG